jgi:hypothetical protein
VQVVLYSLAKSTDNRFAVALVNVYVYESIITICGAGDEAACEGSARQVVASLRDEIRALRDKLAAENAAHTQVLHDNQVLLRHSMHISNCGRSRQAQIYVAPSGLNLSHSHVLTNCHN